MNTCYSHSHKDVISWKLQPKNSCLHFTTSQCDISYENHQKTCWGSLRYYFILVLFPFQIAPLIVIVSTASLGAIAFGIRQATKNPEAWYVSTVFIKPEKNVFVENTILKFWPVRVLCYKNWNILNLSSEVASHVLECKLLEGFCLWYFLFHFPCLVYKMLRGTNYANFGAWRLLPHVAHDSTHEQFVGKLFFLLIRYKQRPLEDLARKKHWLEMAKQKLRNYCYLE